MGEWEKRKVPSYKSGLGGGIADSIVSFRPGDPSSSPFANDLLVKTIEKETEGDHYFKK